MLNVLLGHFFFDRHGSRDRDGSSPRNLFKFSKQGSCSRCRGVGIDSGPFCPSYPLQPKTTIMSNMAVQETVAGTEAGKLQTELRDVFSKILSHARRIDMTLALGVATEALGQVRELESYLERGLVVLSRPLTQEP